VPAHRICPITRLPAKYFDPVTELPYANLQVFTLLFSAVDLDILNSDPAFKVNPDPDPVF
jgi:hypothetical protein